MAEDDDDEGFLSFARNFQVEPSCDDRYYLKQLKICCRHNDCEMARETLRNQFDVNKVFGYFSITMLHYAAMRQCSGIVELLLRRGANVDQKNCFGETALHISALHDDSSTLKVLLKFNPDVNSQCYDGDTPLHNCQTFRVLKMLLLHEPDLGVKNKDGMTAFDLYNTMQKTQFVRGYFACLLEIQRMKTIKLKGDISLLDFSIMPAHLAAIYARNKTVVQIFKKRGHLEERFAHYESLLKDRYWDGICRRRLQMRAHGALESMANFRIPYLCARELFKFLHSEDLKNLTLSSNFPHDK